MSTIPGGASGVSPQFPVTDEDLTIRYVTGLTRITIDGVEPPTIGSEGGSTAAFQQLNYWFPWIDEPLITPKYDGVCQFLGMPSNRPSHVKDYHVISLMRATDYLLAPMYQGLIVAEVDSPIPSPPGTPTT